MKQFFSYLFIIVVVAGLYSCDRRKVFEAYKKIDDKGWNKDSVVAFNVHLTDTMKNHNLFVNIRNKGNYPYSNIYLFLSIVSPDGTNHIDTVEFTLADPSGKWRGKGIGGLHDNQIPYKNKVYFPRQGDYKFMIKQGMRDNVLQGIRDVGFRVETAY